MEKFNDIKRPSESLINALSKLTSATASGELSRMGIKDASITGPVTYNPGKKIMMMNILIRKNNYIDKYYISLNQEI